MVFLRFFVTEKKNEFTTVVVQEEDELSLSFSCIYRTIGNAIRCFRQPVSEKRQEWVSHQFQQNQKCQVQLDQIDSNSLVYCLLVSPLALLYYVCQGGAPANDGSATQPVTPQILLRFPQTPVLPPASFRRLSTLFIVLKFFLFFYY